MRYLILRLSALGDVIHTAPAVVGLREALPAVSFSWVVEAPYREIIEIVAGVETIPVRMKKWGRAFLSSGKEMGVAWRAMRGHEVSIDFQGLVKSAMLGAMAGARTRYGFGATAIREKPALLFTNRKVPVDPILHVVDQNLALARGVAGVETFPAVSLRETWGRYAQSRPELESFADSIVLLPGAGRPEKLWPVERFRELSQRLGPGVVTVWGPGERELAEAIGGRIAPATTLRELAWLLQQARVVIGGDTGPLHLADALGTPVVGLYGPTDPRRNGPYGQLGHCIDHFRGTKCMESISVEEVMTMVERAAAE